MINQDAAGLTQARAKLPGKTPEYFIGQRRLSVTGWSKHDLCIGCHNGVCGVGKVIDHGHLTNGTAFMNSNESFLFKFLSLFHDIPSAFADDAEIDTAFALVYQQSVPGAWSV